MSNASQTNNLSSTRSTQSVTLFDAPPTWRYALYALETDENEESKDLFHDVVRFVKGGDGQGGALTPRQKGRYSLITRDDLEQIVASKHLTGPNALCQALDNFVRGEEAEGLMKKTLKKQREQNSNQATSQTKDESPAQVNNDDEEEEADDPESIEKMAKEAEAEERKRLEQQNFDSAVAALDEKNEAPDRIYILHNFPQSTAEVEMLVEYESKGGRDAGGVGGEKKSSNKNSKDTDLTKKSKNKVQGLLDGVVTIVAESNVAPRGDGSRELIKNPPSDSRPRTAFDAHTTTSVCLKENKRPDSVPLDEEGKKVERDTVHYYTPQHGLASEVAKLMKTKGKLWQDLAIETISTKNATPVEPSSAVTEGEEEHAHAHAEEVDGSAAGAVHLKKTPTEFISDFNTFVGDISIDKVMFKSWVSTMVPVPEIDLTSTRAAMEVAANAPYNDKPLSSTWNRSNLRPSKTTQAQTLSRYGEIVSEVPESVLGCGVMLYAMVTAVMEVVGDSDQCSSNDPSLGYLLTDANGLESTSSLNMTHSGTLGPGMVAISHGDYATARVASGELDLADLADNSNLDSRMLVGIDRVAFKNLQFPRTLGRGSLPLRPKKSVSQRGKERTELLTFTSLSPNDIDRHTQLIQFERLLNTAYNDIQGANDVDPWVLTDRTVVEDFPPFVLSQVLESAMMSSPEMLRSYHPSTDTLLLALHNPTAKGRVGQKLWNPASFVRHRVPFNDWRISPRLDATPRTKEAKNTGVEIRSSDLKKLTTHTMWMFPADHSTICLRTRGSELADAEGKDKNKYEDAVGKVGGKNSWLSVYHDGHVFGLRHPTREGVMIPSRNSSKNESTGGDSGFTDDIEDYTRSEFDKKDPADALREEYKKTGNFAAHYVCDFEGGVRVVGCEGTRSPLKPDGFHTVTLRHVFPSGLVVSNCSDGRVRMDRITNAKVGTFGDKADEELCRIVVGGGSVVRHLRNGDTEILYPDGRTGYRKKGDVDFEIRSISDGVIYRKQADPYTGDKMLVEVGRLERTVEKDPETKVTVVTLTHYESNNSSNNDDDADSGGSNKNKTPLLTRHVTNLDGSVLVVHSDGTVIRSAPRQATEDGSIVPQILVSAKGFASVCLEYEVDKQANAYANGEQIAISKGGDRVRTRTCFPDGGYALTTFDTRITSRVCGRVISVRPDRTEVIAGDDGKILHRGRGLWGGEDTFEEEARRKGNAKAKPNKDKNNNKPPPPPSPSSDPDAQPDPDRESKCYIFDLREGLFATCDPDFNHFRAYLGSCPNSGAVKVDLAGVLGDEVINDGMKKVPAVVDKPVEPRLFVVERDGRGREVLRRSDVDDWERRVRNEGETLKDVTKDEENGRIERFGDPRDEQSFQREFERRIRHPTPRDFSGLFHNFGSLHVKTFGIKWNRTDLVQDWHLSKLPNCCTRYRFRTSTIRKSAPPKIVRNGVYGYDEVSVSNVLDSAPDIVITRRLVTYPSLPTSVKTSLLGAMESCEKWREARQNTIDRFAVEDDRDEKDRKSEEHMSKLLKRAFKAAKATRKRERQTMLKKQNAKANAKAKQSEALFGKAGTSGGEGGLGMTEPDSEAQRVTISPIVEGEDSGAAGMDDLEEDDDEFYETDSDLDGTGGGKDDELEQEMEEARECFENYWEGWGGDGGSDMEEEEEEEEGGEEGENAREKVVDVAGCRGALVMSLGTAVSKASVESMLGLQPGEERSDITFAEFLQILRAAKAERRAKSRNESRNSSQAPEDEQLPVFSATAPAVVPVGVTDVSEEKKDSSTPPPRDYGSFFSTQHGASLREKMLKDDPGYVPKKKGDIRHLSGEPIPKAAVLIRPKTVHGNPKRGDSRASAGEFGGKISGVGDSALTFGDGVGAEGSLSIISGFAEEAQGAKRVSTAPGMISLSRSQSPQSATSFTGLSRLSVHELKVTAAGGGRNAVRAKSLLERAEGKRLREGERPADIDIYGEEREVPVRYGERAKGGANTEYMRVEMDAVSGRRSPDTSLRSLNSSPTSLLNTQSNDANSFIGGNTMGGNTMANAGSMEIMPTACSIGEGVLECGEKYRIALSVGNRGGEGVRYHIKWEGVSGNVKVVEKPGGVVAAGISVAVVLEIHGQEQGEAVDGNVVIKSQNDVVSIPINGVFGNKGNGYATFVKKNKFLSKVQ